MGITCLLFAFFAALSLTGGHLGARVVRSEDLMAGPSLPGNHPSEAPLSVDGVVSDSGLDAVKVINQPMHEVNIDLHNAFAIPLADALAFCGAINELTLLRRQAFETLEAQGVSHREAVAVLNDEGIKEILQETARVAENLKERRLQAQEKFDQAASEILHKYQAMTPQERDDLISAPESILSDKGLPLEYHILKEQAREAAEQDTHDGMLELTRLRGKIETIIQQHPKTAHLLGSTLHGIAWVSDKITDGIAIVSGSVCGLVSHGLCGVAEGAQTGLEVKELIGAGSAEIVDRLVDVTLQPAVETAKTSVERGAFQETATFFKKTAFSVLALTGARHFLKGRPRGKAFSKPLKKVLERKVTVKDGLVYAGEKNLGPIKDMPTLRRFAKPKNAALHECFESDVFDREVLFQGPGTGYQYRVYQRNDIDWGLVRKNPRGPRNFIGKTNLEAAREGYAPELPDGSLVNLHHVGQNGLGPLAEVTTRIHSTRNYKKFKTIHNQFKGKGHPENPATHGQFWDSDRASYWKKRGENVAKR